ncbi:MAG: histidine phosphatase family protein [Anaerolineae bacterium]|nr:histidine phosphatase family protein [Anaerolineae bacterium]
MLSLILIRHGETAWNAERRIQGHTDVPLNAAGEAQARSLVPACRVLRQIEPIPILVLSSPLQRACRTAEIALEGSLPIQTDARLMEIEYGTWSGAHIPTLWQEQPQECERWFAREEREYCPHGGESWHQFRQRALAFHQSAVLPHLNGNDMRILVFSHGGWISETINILLQSAAVYATANASITEILLNPATPPMLKVFNFGCSNDDRFQWMKPSTNEFSKS